MLSSHVRLRAHVLDSEAPGAALLGHEQVGCQGRKGTWCTKQLKCKGTKHGRGLITQWENGRTFSLVGVTVSA